MSEHEEIELLRRELADLRDRVARLENDPSRIAIGPPAGLPPPAIGLSPLPIGMPFPSLPVNPNIWISPQLGNDCGCSMGGICMNAACPRRTTTTFTAAGSTGGA